MKLNKIVQLPLIDKIFKQISFFELICDKIEGHNINTEDYLKYNVNDICYNDLLEFIKNVCLLLKYKENGNAVHSDRYNLS